jgi:O-antigen ligase/tetratricopeptide (TPR) repeat protein
LRRIDYIVLAGIGLLVVFTPLCFGSVHPWAYSLMEQVSFALVAAWMAKAWLSGGRLLRRGGRVAAAAVAAPMAVLLGLLVLETVPLPPGLLARLSPTAYRLYAQVLPGWPTRAPYREVDFNAAPRPPAGPVILPTAQQVRAGAPVPFVPSETAAQARSAGARDGVSARSAAIANGSANPTPAHVVAVPSLDARRWRALSFEPAVTRASLLKGLAYAALFLLVALYPFGAPGEARSEEHFCRAVLAVVLATGLGIAFVGLANWASWNGKILWFFIPLDWGAPQVGMILRARGPFINPDHFADYLAMILPFALAGALFRTDLVPRGWTTALRLGSVLVAFVIVCALLLSLSRGGWAAAAFGVGLLVVMFFLQSERRRAVFARHANARTLRWAAAVALGLFVLALMFVGPQGRSLTTARLTQTAAGSMTMAERAVLWRGSLAMTRDFPLFGVGLGAWGELFTRYGQAPWSPYLFYREAHNDYLQFIAEAGLLAMLALVWVAWRLVRQIAAGLRAGDPRKWPLLAAVVAATGAVALHETVDFSLQIPANAMLLAILLGLGLRAATPPTPGDEMRRGRMPRPVLALAASVALLLIFAATGQRDVYYPDFLPQAKTLRAAVARVSAHPADSDSHFILARLGEGVLSPQAQLHELRSAVSLDPTNPDKRDAYASTLARRGKLKSAEAQVTRSVFNSPSTDTHFYLGPELVHWLAPPTRMAVERGFREAIAARLPGALKGLGDFYALDNRPLKEAQLETEAASRTRDSARRLRLLLGAGQAYAAAGYMTSAEALFRIAMEEAPQDPEPYLDLVRTVYGPDRDMRSAKAVIEEATNAGGDPYRLNLELVNAARQAQDAATEEKAFKDALDVIPEDTDTLAALGEFYIDQGRYDDALLTLEKADDAGSDSARIRFDLGRAQEGAYHYYKAEKSYARAVALAPRNRQFSDYYAEFKRRMAKEAFQIDKAAAPQPAAAPTPAAQD